MLLWITESFGNHYVFTQDGAPSETSNLTQQWCENNFSAFWDKNMCARSNADIRQINLAILSILKSDGAAKCYSIVAPLKNAFLASWSALDEEVVWRS